MWILIAGWAGGLTWETLCGIYWGENSIALLNAAAVVQYLWSTKPLHYPCSKRHLATDGPAAAQRAAADQKPATALPPDDYPLAASPPSSSSFTTTSDTSFTSTTTAKLAVLGELEA